MVTKPSFDWFFYVNYYPDLRGAGITTREKALEHHRTHGCREQRRTYLDVEQYLKSNDPYGELLLCSLKSDSFYGLSHHFFQYLISHIGLLSHASVLEIGCRSVCYSLPLIKHLDGGHFHGTDVDENVIEWCRQHLHTDNTEFRCASIDKNIGGHEGHEGHEGHGITIPFDNCSHDFVYATEILSTHSLGMLCHYFSEINRILKKGGICVLTGFIWGTTSSVPLGTRNSRLKKIIIPTGQNVITNKYLEQASIQIDSELHHILEQYDLELREILYGSWSGTSASPIYQDIVTVTKVKNLGNKAKFL